jgi:hypothetical protein
MLVPFVFRTVPERDCQAETVFLRVPPPRPRRAKSRLLSVRWSAWLLRSSRCLWFDARLGCRRSGKLQSFFADAIAPNTFLRKVPLTMIVSSSARQRCQVDADVSGANSSPSGPLHPKRRAAGLGHGWPKPPHPRSEPSWPKREGSRVARWQPRSNNRAEACSPVTPLCIVQFDGPSWRQQSP